MRHLLLPLLAALAGPAAAASKCYYPEGNEATDYKYMPCGGDDTAFATCCIFEEGDVCLPNGLCHYPDHYDYRAACQDPTWEKCQQGACPDVRNNTWIMVQECATGEYCCNEDKDKDNCCKDGLERFDLTSLSPSPSSTTGVSSDGSEAASTPTEAGSGTPDPTSSWVSWVEKSTEVKGGLSDGAKGAIGGSIGGVAAIALGVLAWWMVRRRRRAAGAEAAELPVGEGKKAAVADGGYYARDGAGGGGGVVAAEMEGSSVAVESDSRPVAEVGDRY